MAFFDLREMEWRDRYFLMTRVIGPRPIAFVSTINTEGVGNLAPFSCFMMGGNNPTSCIFMCGNRKPDVPKDTLANIEAIRQYVINVVNYDMAQGMNQCAWDYPPGTDEFDPAGFTRVESKHVKPPRVAEAPIALECELFDIVRHGPEGKASNYIIGEVLCAHVKDEVLGDDGLPDAYKLDLLARMGGNLYARITPDAILPIDRPEGP